MLLTHYHDDIAASVVGFGCLPHQVPAALKINYDKSVFPVQTVQERLTCGLQMRKCKLGHRSAPGAPRNQFRNSPGLGGDRKAPPGGRTGN